ncbi:MAG: hypothetical protein HY321_19110 [Armatimonadetes bacterium]|nr:hypothetical protein [Armatimonadota bacterium]
MTLAEWAAALNDRIKDSGNVLFTAAEKEAHIQAAVQEYGRRRPRHFYSDLTITAGTQAYALPGGCAWVVEAILPGPAIETLQNEDPEDAAVRLRGWLLVDDHFYLFPVPREDATVKLHCVGSWAVDEVPDEESELVLLAAHARCCEVLATDSARAFAFWSGNEKFDRSQVSEHYRALAGDLWRQFARRLPA